MKFPFLKKLAGNFNRDPSEARLGQEAEELIAKAFDGVPKGEFIDCHAHIIGTGTGGTGCWTNPSILNWTHPLDHLKVMVYINASGIEDMRYADQQYLQRFLTQVRDFPHGGKFMLLALDKVYDKDGTPNEQDTKFYVPNDYIYKIYQSDKNHFIPCISVHPYRKDAVAELDKWGRRGIKAVKWLPNTMGMNPADPVCEPFYEKMREYDMVLLGHAGKESAIEVVKFKLLGNPLFYRKPLEMGVKVIMAHCASLGADIDEDSPMKKPVKNYKLFLRLMEEKKYEELLFADISAMTQVNRMGKPLKAILQRTDLHHRLINGSDYPLPAVNSVVSTKAFQMFGYISGRERNALNEIYKRNPLLFDFVLKRTIKEPGNSSNKFSTSIFSTHPILQLSKPLKERGQKE